MTDIVPMDQNFLDFLVEDLAPPTEKMTMPRVSIVQGMSKGHPKGTIGKFCFKFEGREPIYVDSFRFVLIDGNLPSRAMWELDEKGKATLKSKTPLCASSDGVSARKGDIFNYIGSRIRDWRNGSEVVIQENNCAKCPLSNWVAMPRVDEYGEPVLDKNGKVIKDNLKPPCQDTSQFVFLVYDLENPESATYSVFQISNPTVGQFTKGTTARSKRGAIMGVRQYYNPTGKTPEGRAIMPICPDGHTYYAIVATTDVVETGQGQAYVPMWRVDDTPLDSRELKDWGDAKMEYNQMAWHERLTGTFFEVREDSIYEEAPDQLESGEGVSSEEAKSARMKLRSGKGAHIDTSTDEPF